MVIFHSYVSLPEGIPFIFLLGKLVELKKVSTNLANVFWLQISTDQISGPQGSCRSSQPQAPSPPPPSAAKKKTGPAEYKARFTGESSGDWTGLEDR